MLLFSCAVAVMPKFQNAVRSCQEIHFQICWYIQSVNVAPEFSFISLEMEVAELEFAGLVLPSSTVKRVSH